MFHLCFGTFFTLLCGNKKDWDKLRKLEVPNRVLYFALLDIVDKHSSAPDFNVNKAKSGENKGYKDDVVSDAKTCKRDDHPIQRHGSMVKYADRFTNEHPAVLSEFKAYIDTYLDDQQLNRLALSVLELIINCGINDDSQFFIGDSPTIGFTKKAIDEKKRDYNLPCLLAGVIYYIIKENIPNGSYDAQATIEEWKTSYPNAPYCPSGESLGEDFSIQLTLEVALNKETHKNDTNDNTDFITATDNNKLSRFLAETTQCARSLEIEFSKEPHNISNILESIKALVTTGRGLAADEDIAVFRDEITSIYCDLLRAFSGKSGVMKTTPEIKYIFEKRLFPTINLFVAENGLWSPVAQSSENSGKSTERITMIQGDNGIQIKEISGGNVTFNLGGNQGGRTNG
ncbi:MAG: hypothetical protein FWG90_02790 [Oscillospiraceae bacterium]|nr:hypothetical protein [Oscillospiraceae bacterium]